MWSEIEQAYYFNRNIKDVIECPFLGISDVNCSNCIFEKSLCANKGYEFNECFELSSKIILVERQKKLKRIIE